MITQPKMHKIYFLCTGNSCRSQMAEGFAKKIFDNSWQVRSAGIEMHGVNPYAIKVMAEKGIDISHNKSKLIDEDYLRACDYVVTLCGDARDKCPYTPNSVKKEHWPLPDPAQITGSEEVKLAGFRQVRDEIEKLVDSLFNLLKNK